MPSSIAQSTNSSRPDSTRAYQLPYWKAKKLYSIAYTAALCDSLVTQQEHENHLLKSKSIAQDSLLAISEEKFKNAVLSSKIWEARYVNQIDLLGYYRRKSETWKWLGIACIALGTIIAIR